jgi:hypothetical protein
MPGAEGSAFTGLKTVSPRLSSATGAAAAGSITHRSMMADRKTVASQQTYRQQAAARRQELAARARRTAHPQPVSSWSTATRGASSQPPSRARSPQPAPCDREVGSHWRTRREDGGGAPLSPRGNADPVSADRSRARSVSPRGSPASVRRRMMFGGGSAPPAERPLSTSPPPPEPAPASNLGERGRSAAAPNAVGSSRGTRPTPRGFSSRATPRAASTATTASRQVPPVDLGADRGGASAASREPTSRAPASSRRERSRSPAPIAKDTYERLLACGAYRPVLRASELQRGPAPSKVSGADAPEKKSEILRQLRERITRSL